MDAREVHAGTMKSIEQFFFWLCFQWRNRSLKSQYTLSTVLILYDYDNTGLLQLAIQVNWLVDDGSIDMEWQKLYRTHIGSLLK